MQLARMQNKIWSVCKPRPCCDTLAKALNIHPILATVLVNRGVTDPEPAATFLKPKLTELIQPDKMPGIGKAITRIQQALKEKEKITIYGDYDVDGITSVSILLELFQLLGANVDFYIPHRIDEGYGLNPEAVKEIAQAGAKLLITVDCGISALDSADLAAQLGMDLIITDHHQFGAELPRAAAIVHPCLDPDYPNPDSCGAMVAFKLAWAVANQFNNGSRLTGPLRDFMLEATSFAAMGTIADVVDLRGENRILASYGLKSLAQSNISGVKALIESASLTGQNLDSFDIGFRLAPLLNAAGRMGHARLAVELLTSKNDLRSFQIARYLKEQNEQRRKTEKEISKKASEMVIAKGLHHPDRRSIVLADDNWHLGVIGIVASRLIDKYYRPTILLNISNGVAQGSARSIEGFDLYAAIKSCSEHLITFGGHKMAAGLSLAPENIDAFSDALEEYAQNNLTQNTVSSKLHIDGLLPLKSFSRPLVDDLQTLGPFGQGNPQPVFATNGVRLAAHPRKVGAKGDHLQITITDSTATMKCIGFGFGKLEKKLLEKDAFNIAYQPQINTYNGNSTVQLVITDIQFEQ